MNNIIENNISLFTSFEGVEGFFMLFLGLHKKMLYFYN